MPTRHRFHRLAALAPCVAALATLACSSGTAPSRARLIIDRDALTLYRGRFDTLRATATDTKGGPSAAPIAWSSADRQVATVDSLGAVYGNAAGRTTITATSGLLSSQVAVTVVADTTKPQILAVERATSTIDLTNGDATLSLLVRGRDLESGIRWIDVIARHPTRPTDALLNHSCAPTLESGTPSDGAWRCIIALHHYAAPGTWRVGVRVYDWNPWPPNFDSTGFDLTVINPRIDVTPPTLVDLTFTTQRVDEAPYGESRLMSMTLSDDASGALSGEYYLDSDSSRGVYGCGAARPFPPPFPWQPTRVVTGTCPVPLVASSAPVYRTISLVRMTDARGNMREMRTEELARAGIVTRIDIRK